MAPSGRKSVTKSASNHVTADVPRHIAGKNRKGADTASPSYKEFSRQLAALHLKIRPIEGDGNCMFRAVSDFVSGDQSSHAAARTRTIVEMTRNRAEYQPFVAADDGAYTSYLSKMSRNGEWAGHVELMALSRAYESTIVVHQLYAPRLVIQHEHAANTIHIAYHDNEHYSSVHNEADDINTPATPIHIAITEPSSSASSSSSSGQRNWKDHLIMSTTGCSNAVKVRRMMDETGDDVDAVIQLLTLEAEQTDDINVDHDADEQKYVEQETESKSRAADERTQQPSSSLHSSVTSSARDVDTKSQISADKKVPFLTKSVSKADGVSVKPLSNRGRHKQLKAAKEEAKKVRATERAREKAAANKKSSPTPTTTDTTESVADNFGSLLI